MSGIQTDVERLGPQANGSLLSPAEFDSAEFEPGWRYELVQGVLVVNPPPSLQERDPNEELGHWLRDYQSAHPQGSALDFTVSEQTVQSGPQRRRVDRAIWAGLGRLPGENETPTIAVEFVSAGRRSRQRDSAAKADEYREAGVLEYWIIDRFQRSMTVHVFVPGRRDRRVVAADQTYTTPLLPGFELPLSRLFALADRWN